MYTLHSCALDPRLGVDPPLREREEEEWVEQMAEQYLQHMMYGGTGFLEGFQGLDDKLLLLTECWRMV